MIVTAIENHTKNKYKIYLNDAFAFVLYKGDLRHYDISVGRELSGEELEEIREQVLAKRAKMRAMHLLQDRDYTEEGMRRKLKDGLYPDEIIEEAIAYVKQFHYIDDARYARSYIQSHALSLSARQITEKLKSKGIRSDVISAAFASCEEESGLDAQEMEMRIVKEQMLKKMRTMGSLREEKQKLFAYLYRKGFSYSAIEKAYESCTADHDV